MINVKWEARITRCIKVRPISVSGINKTRDWLMNKTQEKVFASETAHEKAKKFQEILLSQSEQIFPEKNRKISLDDAPWINQKLKNWI